MLVRCAAGALFVTAACASSSPPAAPAHAPTREDCQPLGTWRVTWATDADDARLHALGRELDLRVDATTAEVDGWRVLVGTSEDNAGAEVDRDRCTARVTLRSEFSFADDAGHRTEALTLEVELHGDGGDARGALHLVEVGDEAEDRHVTAHGHAARVVDE